MFQEIVFATYLNFVLSNNGIHFHMHAQQMFFETIKAHVRCYSSLGTPCLDNKTLLYTGEVKIQSDSTAV